MSSADLMYRLMAFDVDSKCIPYGFQNHCTAKKMGDSRDVIGTKILRLPSKL